MWSPGSPAPFTKPLTWVLSALAQGHLSVSQSTSLLCVHPAASWPPAAFLLSCPPRSPCLCWLSHSRSSPCKSAHFPYCVQSEPYQCNSADLSAEPDPEKTALTVASQPEICRHTLAALDPVHPLYPAQLLGLGSCRCPAWPLAPAAGLTRLQS